jgi:serine phosphatase RsbU (regulator of sigma subunit)
MPKTDRILIIDDEPELRTSIHTYLEDSGFEVLEAQNGQEGISLFRAQKPDCVITDLQMPNGSGLAVLETIRQEFPDTPILVLSGQGVMQDAIQALRLGAWDYLLKPIPDMAVLEHAVCRALERSRLLEDNKRYRAEIERTNAALKKTLDILEEDLTAGRRVQAQLSPPPQAEIGEYRLSFSIEPSLYLSGDFVDYFQVGDEHLVFYVADVSGHGASSAFVTVLLKSLVHQLLGAYLVSKEPTVLMPQKILSKLTKEIYSAKLGKYLTIVYAVLNLKTHVVRYSIGGHYPNPLFHNQDEIRFLEGKGFPVGIMATANFDEFEVTIPPKAQWVMFSDGVLEILGDKELKDKEAYLKDLVQHRNTSLEELIEALEVKKHTSLPDDISIVRLERL